MPLAALIEENILCMHGGIPKDLYALEQINEIQKPLEIPDEGHSCQLLWNDPDTKILSWKKSTRGVGYLFSRNDLNEFVAKFDLDLICRAHQVMESGYQFFGKHKHLVTVFSAKNYCGDWDNDGAVLNVDKNMRCSFKVFKHTIKTTKNQQHKNA